MLPPSKQYYKSHNLVGKNREFRIISEMFELINIIFSFIFPYKIINQDFFLCQSSISNYIFVHKFKIQLLQKQFVCSFNKNNKYQLRRTMQKQPLKQDFQTELLSSESIEQSKQAFNAVQQLTTINAIMDQIHQEAISNKTFTRVSDNDQNKIQCKKWGRKQTENFFLLLAKMGPDFTYMEMHQVFNGNRCKRQLKNKYRKEQKKNGSKVNIFLDMYYDRKCTENIEN